MKALSLIKDFFDPKAKSNIHLAQKKIVDLPPIKDSQSLPMQTENFKEWHIKFLRRLDNHQKNESFTGIISKEVDISNFIPILENLDLITTASYLESLALLKVENLKQILRENNLPVSGKKQILVDRIISNVDESSITNSSFYAEFYKLTPSGKKLVEDSQARFESEHVRFFKDTVTSIMNCKLNDAYRMICKRNAESPTPQGLGCNWKERYYSGLNNITEQKYIQRLQNAAEILTTSVAIYSEMSGDSYRDISNWIPKAFPDNLLHEVDFCTEIHTASIKEELNDLLKCGIKKYRFAATFDAETCSVCGKLDGRNFLISDAVIGKNCPPMHKGCRCTIVAYTSSADLSGQKRARNPFTGKSELIPTNLTYSQWKKQYLQK